MLVLLLVSGPALAQTCSGFWENNISSSGTNGAAAVFAIDLDGDGDTDIISASYNDDKIAWYEADDATPPGFTQHVITTEADGVTSVFAVDVDLDGDIDIIAAAPYANEIVLYEHIGSNPPGFFKTVISDSANRPVAVYATDVDGDGDVDVLSASFGDNKIAWYENPEIVNTDLNPDGGSDNFVKHVVTSNASRASSVFAIDMDGDGDTDILSASTTDNKIAWYQAELGTVTNADDEEVPAILWTEYLISDQAVGAKSVYAADLDNDGDPDVASASSGDNKIAWYANDIDTSGAAPLIFTEHVVSAAADGANSVYVSDVDSDGHLDLLSASGGDNTIAWYRNDGGSPPSFEAFSISVDTESADAVFAADVDHDGNMDVLSASSVPGSVSRNDKIAWYRNDGSSPPVWSEQVVSETAEGSNWLHQADLNGDGDSDLVSASTNGKILWYQVEDGPEPAFTRHLIADDFPGASSVFAADLDSDGDQDVIAASAERDRILWYANIDAMPGTFEAGRIVTTNALSVESVVAADVDGDGFPDVLSASPGDDKVAWYENDGQSPPGFTEHAISSNDSEISPFRTEGARSVFATDLDGDEYIDVLVASFGDDKISWFEWAPDALPPDPPWVQTILASDDSAEAVYRAYGASSVSAADIDGDGDGDVLSASAGDHTIAWYEQTLDDDGVTTVFVRHSVDAAALIAAFVSAADIDSDGDQDILSASTGNDQIAWYENDIDTDDTDTSDGQDLIFTKHVIESSGANPRSVVVRDVTQDGRVDLFAGQRFKVSWFEQIGELCTGFDANGDGLIDGTELAWLGRAFGMSSLDPPLEWWYVIDFNMDGFVDGDDLAILADSGVWGKAIDECSYTCK